MSSSKLQVQIIFRDKNLGQVFLFSMFIFVTLTGLDRNNLLHQMWIYSIKRVKGNKYQLFKVTWTFKLWRHEWWIHQMWELKSFPLLFIAFVELELQSTQNIWQKVKNYSKIGQDLKNVISNFYLIFRVFLTDIVNINFWNEDWALLNV